jgi:protein phosphatase
VADDENDQSATADAFELVHAIAAKRLARRRLTVIDATNLRPEDRGRLVDLARRHHAPPVALAFDLPEDICLARNAARPGRTIPSEAVREHVRRFADSLPELEREGFRGVHVMRSTEATRTAHVTRAPLACDRRGEHGPFDIIGDIHGCLAELEALLDQLGHVATERDGGIVRAHPEGRRVIFLGDLVDRGPDSPGVLRLAMDMVAAGGALAVPGNHDMKLARKLAGRNVRIAHGLAITLEQFESIPDDRRQPFRDEVQGFLDGLPSHLWLDEGRLVAAHAGMKEDMQGRDSDAVRAFALFGESTGEIDEYGLPVRLDWAAGYRGRATVVHGHTPLSAARFVNDTICVDTGCVFGGALTALRYPERELVSVPAARVYWEPRR